MYEKLCLIDDLPATSHGRLDCVILSSQRPILLIKYETTAHAAAFRAIDRFCFHAGEPLDFGVLQQVDDSVCIICPKHLRLIDIEDGDSFIPMGSQLVKRDRVHRTHKVRVDHGDGFIYICENRQADPPFESDRHNSGSKGNDNI